jgi:hypothetical protein
MFTQPKIKMARYADRYRNHELQFEYYSIDNVLSTGYRIVSQKPFLFFPLFVFQTSV